ncbi:cyclin-dependent kinase 4 inhibitor C-like [Haliotis asinina]|uniref:cyclin-dependent kinase 4 inhibitor C-like n=1 Tax=Haliotis asinina TaxID=109174 RepID=UPI003531D805
MSHHVRDKRISSTDQSPSNTVPPAPVTTQDSDPRASTTDASQDLIPSTTVPPAPVTKQDSDHHPTPSPATGRDLFYASRSGDLERVRRILAGGHVNINYRMYSWTSVMKAIVSGHRDVVELLVGRGADVSLVDRRGNNVLHLACENGHLETVKLILSLGVLDVNARNNAGKTAADLARYMGRQRVLDLLVSHGAH